MPIHAEGAASSDALGDRPVEALLDTSTAVALMVADHADYALVIDVTRGKRLGLAGHAWFEMYSVLTRMPSGLRRSPADIRRLMAHDFHGSWFLDVVATVALTDELARLRIAGGAVYDALVGAAARYHDLPLLTSDRRALGTYDVLGVRICLLGD